MLSRLMSPINAGFIGYGGSVKRYHLPFIQVVPDIRLYAFLQRSPAPDPSEETPEGTHCTVDFPDARHYRTLEEFLADEKIDLVIICTPPETHASLALQIIKAGKSLVIEKPFTVTSEDADSVINAAKTAGVTLSVYQNRRYDSDFRTLQQVVALDFLGDIQEAEFHHDLPGPSWLSRLSVDRIPGRGMAYTAGTHIIDQALALFGLPIRVTAIFRSFRGVESDNEDSYIITLQYATPLVVTLTTHSQSIMPRQMTNFARGTRGSFINFGGDPQMSQVVEQGMRPSDEGFGSSTVQKEWATLSSHKKVSEFQQKGGDGIWSGPYAPVPGQWSKFYSDLARTLNSGSELVIDPELSRAGIRIVELAWESHSTGRTIPFA